MKLRRGQRRYKLPPFSQVTCVYIDADQRHNPYAIALPILPIGHIRPTNKNGRPDRCAVYADWITFEPPPDKAYTVKVRYAPPLMEF